MRLPVPLEPDVIVSQGMSKDFEAVHEQLAAVVTFTLPVPPWAPKLWLVGSIKKVQAGVTVAVMHCENSEVLPAASVAVAVITWPAATADCRTIALPPVKSALQLLSVVNTAAPRKALPSP